MIKLYRAEKCPDCDRLEEALKELAIAHKVVFADKEAGAESNRGNVPALVDGDDRVAGHTAVFRYIDRMKMSLALWDQFQVDTCCLCRGGGGQ